MFAEYIESFNNNIIGLRDFVELINPFLNEHKEGLEKQHKGAFDAFDYARRHFLEKDEIKKVEYGQKLKEVFDGEIEVSVNEDETANDDKPKKLLFKIKGDSSKFDKAFESLAKSAKQQELLYQNSLISLLSTKYSSQINLWYCSYL